VNSLWPSGEAIKMPTDMARRIRRKVTLPGSREVGDIGFDQRSAQLILYP